MIPSFRLSDLVPSARELHSYYRYVGSMTTPGCEQAVAWTLFHRTLPISSRQVSRVQILMEGWLCTDLFLLLAVPAGCHRPAVQILDRTAHDGHIQTHAASGWQSGVPFPSQCCPEAGAPAVGHCSSSRPGNAAALNQRIKTPNLCDFARKNQ